MLILNRNIGESIYIGDEVRLTVIDVDNEQVRIGIHAPREIPVHREEIYYRIKHQQHTAEADSSGNGNGFQQYSAAKDDSSPTHRRWPMCWTKTQQLA